MVGQTLQGTLNMFLGQPYCICTRDDPEIRGHSP